MKNCVVRTYSDSDMATTKLLEIYLNNGWIVKTVTPFMGKNGQTEFIEYIVEKDE
jgi:hypothetical protein